MYVTRIDVEDTGVRERRHCALCGNVVEDETVVAIAHCTDGNERVTHLGFACGTCFEAGESGLPARIHDYVEQLEDEDSDSEGRVDLLRKLAAGVIEIPPSALLWLCRDDADLAANLDAQKEGGHLGLCPICQHTDGLVTVRDEYWMVCHGHRKRWLLGRIILPKSHLEDEETWARNETRIAGYELIVPFYPEGD